MLDSGESGDKLGAADPAAAMSVEMTPEFELVGEGLIAELAGHRLGGLLLGLLSLGRNRRDSHRVTDFVGRHSSRQLRRAGLIRRQPDEGR